MSIFIISLEDIENVEVSYDEIVVDIDNTTEIELE